MYKCRVPDCDRAKRGAKSTAYKEFIFHCYQTHGLMKTALEESMEMATTEVKKQKFRQLIAAVVKDGQEHLEVIPEPSVEEIHVCLICNESESDCCRANNSSAPVSNTWKFPPSPHDGLEGYHGKGPQWSPSNPW